MLHLTFSFKFVILYRLQLNVIIQKHLQGQIYLPILPSPRNYFKFFMYTISFLKSKGKLNLITINNTTILRKIIGSLTFYIY